MKISDKITIMLCGRTGSGKTAQLGRLIEWVYREYEAKSRIYVKDPGGIIPIQPYLNLGIAEAVYAEKTDPWIFLHCATRGLVRDGNGWVEDHNPDIGGWFYEGVSSFGEGLKGDLAYEAGRGYNIGGEKLITFDRESEGVQISVGGNNRSHFGIIQQHLYDEIMQSFKLPGRVIGWTSRLATKADEDQQAAVITGPEVLGKAKTGDVPAWFEFCWRLDVEIKNGVEKHILYLGQHKDKHTMGGPLALGNARVPLDAEAPELVIEPADVLVALEKMAGLQEQAEASIKARLGL